MKHQVASGETQGPLAVLIWELGSTGSRDGAAVIYTWLGQNLRDSRSLSTADHISRMNGAIPRQGREKQVIHSDGTA
jgi:hypothetical protein